MILTPKNWNSFQHYKDRSPAWIKLHRGLLDDYKFGCLPVASKALAPFLWLLASEYEDGKISATLDELAFRLRMTRGDLADALTPLLDSGFFDASEPLAPCKQASIPEKEEEREKEEEKNTTASPRVCSHFDEFWKEYPKRDGDNPRKPAEKKFNALVKTGVDAQVIIDGAKQAAAEARRRNIFGTTFVPQAVTWLNQQRFLDCAAQALAVETTEPDWDAICKMYKTTGRWSRYGGNDPSSPNCRCPPEILQKYGIQRAAETVQ